MKSTSCVFVQFIQIFERDIIINLRLIKVKVFWNSFESIVCHKNKNVIVNFVYDLWKYGNGLLCKL